MTRDQLKMSNPPADKCVCFWSCCIWDRLGHFQKIVAHITKLNKTFQKDLCLDNY